MKDKINLNVIIMAVAIVLIGIFMFSLDICKVTMTMLGITESVSANIGDIDDTALIVIATLLMIAPAIFTIVSTFVLDSKKQKDLIKLISMIVSGVALVGIVIVCFTLFDSESLLGVTAKTAPTITTYISIILSLGTCGLLLKETVLDSKK